MNREDNRLQVFFDGKPDADTRAELKSNGCLLYTSQCTPRAEKT